MSMNRRQYLETLSGTVAVTALAGCSGLLNEYSDMANDGEQLNIDPAAAILTPDDLPE